MNITKRYTEQEILDLINIKNTNYLYQGEFGYFNAIILGELQKYINFHENLEEFIDNKLTIYTFPDYNKILKIIFGYIFDYKDIELMVEK